MKCSSGMMRAASAFTVDILAMSANTYVLYHMMAHSVALSLCTMS